MLAAALLAAIAVQERTDLPAKTAEEIIVTARKREESVQKVPVAVTVVTGEQLEEKSVADLSELQTEVPNLAISQGRNQSTTLTVFLRGVGQVDPLWGVDPGVGIYLDDVYIARAQGALLDVFDVSRIEVLRGPQGTLYGKNTIGGAIKYVSRPITENLSGLVSITSGTQSTIEFRASVADALVPGKLRGRIAIASLQHGGYGENLYTGRGVSNLDTKAARATLEWLVAGNTRVQFSGDYTDDDAQPKGYQRLSANPFCPAFLGTSCAPLDSRFDTQSGLEPLNGTNSRGGSIVVASELSPEWHFKSISAYRRSDTKNNIDFDTTPARIADVIGILDDHEFSEELQLNYSGHERWSGVAGLYYFDGEAGGTVKNIFLDSQFTTSNGKTLTDSFALFGDVTYRLSNGAHVNAGLRATRESKNGIAFNGRYTDDSFKTITAVTADYNKTKTFTSIAPRFGVDYQLNGDALAYLTVSRGFKSGGFNIRAQAMAFPQSTQPFDDEVLDMGEIGVKSVFMDGRIVLNTALFDGKYHHVQVSTFTAYDSNGDGVADAFFGDFLNAGNATIRGAEIEFDGSSRAVQWLGVSGFASWLHARPDEFLDRNQDGFVDTQVITNAPDFTGSLNFNFHAPLRRGLLTASAGATYRGSAILTNEGGMYPGRPGMALLPISQAAYTLVEAWVSWLSPNTHWRVGINGKNLTDKGYLTSGYNVPALGILTGSYGAPRTVTATIEYRLQ